MFVLGFATADEIKKLEELGWDIEAASKFGVVAPYTADEANVEDQGFFVRGDGYLLTKPEPGPDETQAIAVFVDASLYRVLIAAKGSKTLGLNSLNVEAFMKRRGKLQLQAVALRAEGENFKYCSHKNPDGSDARYPIGNGETACACGNKWD